MIVTQTIHMDLVRGNNPPQIHAVQGDTCSRSITVKLSADGHPWCPPSDITVAVRYRKPDGTGGHYSTLPDGTGAWSMQANAVCVILAPQMLTVPGRVTAQLEIIQKNHLLATFAMDILVEKDPAFGVIRSEDYVNWLQRVEDRLDCVLLQAKESGLFTGPVGPMPELGIGTVTTLEAGSTATAAIRGTTENPLLDLGIPRGLDFGVESAEHPGCYYRTVDGKTEWINPPMELAVEYRLTERWNGAPVYVKSCNFGTLPNTSTKYLHNVYPTSASPIALDGYGTDAEGMSYDLQALSGIGSMWAGHGYLALATTTDRSLITATVIVRYVK